MDADGTMAWEDLHNGGDQDFNDDVVRVSELDAGNDTFILALVEGTDAIVDFETGSDLIGLRDSLGFDDLTLKAAGRGDTEVVAATSDEDGEEVLSVLSGVSPDSLSTEDFFPFG